ncbi:hypothetical protein JS533_013220 [Bifidobacterium amazonense]|uniref:Uncharacterized protein n=2 Tax=Bifidobacterium TaxID=1678 RepID=A0ABS9VYL6_9BIFI|nr:MULTISPECIES: hypothetical protein [Bifidobacterium]MBT1173583.1 hypothetical protein [Bifidobacterium santillanense]MCH9277210.1 hypothetical protein [Bifidobacterium amazonense]
MAKPLTFTLENQDDDGDVQKSLGQRCRIVMEDGTSIKAYIDRVAGGGASITVASLEEIDKLFESTTTTKEV